MPRRRIVPAAVAGVAAVGIAVAVVVLAVPARPVRSAAGRRARRSAWLSALTGAGVPASGCSPQSRFAVISVSGDYVVVELGGCWRVQRDEAHVTLGTADPSVLRRLLGVH